MKSELIQVLDSGCKNKDELNIFNYKIKMLSDPFDFIMLSLPLIILNLKISDFLSQSGRFAFLFLNGKYTWQSI